MKANTPAGTSILDGFAHSDLADARVGGLSRQPFNLFLTTSHPDSADEWAGGVVRVPVEFTEGAVLIDFSELTRIDSWGIALCLEAMQRITGRGGHLILISVHEEVRRILETAKLDQVFDICSTREEALAKHSHPLAA